MTNLPRNAPGIYLRNPLIVGPYPADDEWEPHQIEMVHALLDYTETQATPLAVVAEYINEAHHQDGYGYWDEFADVQELIEDFQLYLDNRVDDDDGEPLGADAGYCADS